MQKLDITVQKLVAQREIRKNTTIIIKSEKKKKEKKQ